MKPLIISLAVLPMGVLAISNPEAESEALAEAEALAFAESEVFAAVEAELEVLPLFGSDLVKRACTALPASQCRAAPWTT
jgi:hypothetical protein